MLTRNPSSLNNHADPVPTLLRHLETGNDVIRIGVVQALTAQAPGDDRARRVLLDALRDEDLDVRTDAMNALAVFALPEDADVIRESLVGDPVREVKQLAIQLLVDLKDEGSVSLFRALAKDRCEDQVAWEDEAGLWDEWLEIQVAVIRALGQLGGAELARDLLAARDDEFGQNLDLPVFSALAQMGSEGLTWLLSVAQTETGLPRKRALEAMAMADPEALRDHMEYLLADKAAQVRRLALPLVNAKDDLARQLCLADPDAGLRAEALAGFAPDRPDLAVPALSDSAAVVQAVALDHLEVPVAENLQEALAGNMQAWLATGDGNLSTAAARNWFRVFPAAPHAPLLDLIRDEMRPLEARIAAIDALAGAQDDAATERLVSLLGNSAQQVRLVALTHLVTRSSQGDEKATEALTLAAEGVLLSPDASVIERAKEQGVDAAADRDDLEEDEGPRLRVTEDGDVVDATKDQIQTSENVSTLQAIQLARVPSETTKKARAKRKRRAVEGPDEIAQDLARVALGLFGKLTSDQVFEAILGQASNTDDVMRVAAYRALSQQPAEKLRVGQARELIARALMDRNDSVRAIAAGLASQDPALRDGVAALINDPDVLVRVAAVGASDDPDALLGVLSDSAGQIREMAFERLRDLMSADLTATAFDHLLAAGRIDTLRSSAQKDLVVRDLALSKLDEADLSKLDLHVVLGALSPQI
ncbi:HEAT repeat domain-containing protein [Pelagimonas varians]|uniref:HEAT repeat protein n=1 Tax=Pelagimonas varians TaxID=696760 RepID=A0A238K0W0_9RHOB|nr:HEAT repeat domain-containing protein [Pelagimonas varians]PYG33379.1 HEAT repeat protein [Pelagimonas varians]SMX36529.1 hypothetical protein PEV8663_00838 [Pelagimonas varians]